MSNDFELWYQQAVAIDQDVFSGRDTLRSYWAIGLSPSDAATCYKAGADPSVISQLMWPANPE